MEKKCPNVLNIEEFHQWTLTNPKSLGPEVVQIAYSLKGEWLKFSFNALQNT